MSAQVKRLPIPDKYLANIDPEFKKLWDEHGAYTTRCDERPIEEYRANPSSLSFTYPTWSGPEVFDARDYQVMVFDPPGSITVRVYTPEGPGPFPVHVNFHGGGWTIGGLGMDAAWCREICNRVRMVVVDVDYRLAPEVRFPVALYDSWTTVKWVISHAKDLDINPDSLSIGGLSAGGQMSAVMAHFARDEGISLKLQLLTVGAFDYSRTPAEGKDLESSGSYESLIFYKDVPWGPLARHDYFTSHWIGPGEKVRQETFKDWRCSPMLAPNLKNLAPAFIVTAELDTLRDEAEMYGKLLREAGNEVEIKRYPGMPHPFALYNHPEKGLSKAQEYIRDSAAVLARAHGVELCAN